MGAASLHAATAHMCCAAAALHAPFDRITTAPLPLWRQVQIDQLPLVGLAASTWCCCHGLIALPFASIAVGSVCVLSCTLLCFHSVVRCATGQQQRVRSVMHLVM